MEETGKVIALVPARPEEDRRKEIIESLEELIGRFEAGEAFHGIGVSIATAAGHYESWAFGSAPHILIAADRLRHAIHHQMDLHDSE